MNDKQQSMTAFGAPSGPVIGISGQAPASASVIAMMTQIRTAGGKAVWLDHSDPSKANAHLGQIDGLVVMGSDNDIDPSEYGAEKCQKTNVYPENDPKKAQDIKNRAAYENALIQGALKEKVPLYGVCAGMQRINVNLGGTLHQHLPDIVGDNSYDQSKIGIAPYVPVKHIGIRPGSHLSGISQGIESLYAPRFQDNMPPEIISENAFHHQAVATVGKGLAVSAISKDGVVEAIEADPEGPHADQFVLGVQFHPEFCASKLGPSIAHSFVAEAQQCATIRPHRYMLNASWQQFVSTRADQSQHSAQR